MTRILIVVGNYLPGHKAGGPLRTISNLVDWLGDLFQFFIFTRDRDHTDTEAYEDVPIGKWASVNKAQVYYAAPEQFSIRCLHSLIRSIKPDSVYLNGFFEPLCIRYLLARRFKIGVDLPVVISPRGQLSKGALTLKSFKKKSYLFVGVKVLKLYNGLEWHATSLLEAKDIYTTVGREAVVKLAPNLSPRYFPKIHDTDCKTSKGKGAARFVFCSRISPKKNLHWFLGLLGSLRGSIYFTIYGPVEDAQYWAQCKNLIQALPHNVSVIYEGELSHSKVILRLRQNDFFVLPTLGENFGHAILEGWTAGCPVVISDQTPWRKLIEKGIGWDIPLNQPEVWRNVLQRCIDMEQRTYVSLSQKSSQFAQDWISKPPLKETIGLFFS